MRGILKSRAVTPELVQENSSLAVKSKEVADKALNIINPYRWPLKHNLQYQLFPQEIYQAPEESSESSLLVGGRGTEP